MLLVLKHFLVDSYGLAQDRIAGYSMQQVGAGSSSRDCTVA
jgi:hypothetical protein